MKLIAKPKNLKTARKATGYTQRDMAELISAFFSYKEPVTEATYNKWESGGRKVDLPVAKCIATIVNRPIHKIFTSGAAPVFKAK